MEKLLEKLSDYDLWGVIFPGIIFNISTVIIYNWIYIGSFSFDFLNSFGNTVAFIFISYLVGILLQEIGNKIEKKVFFRKGNPAQKFLSKESGILSDKEKELFIELVKSEYNNKFNPLDQNECRIVFNYINTYLAMKGLSAKCDKIQALFVLSRGLFCSFLINIIYIDFILIFFNDSMDLLKMWSCLSMCFFILIVLYRRTTRYAKARIKIVCQIYYISSTKNI